MQTTMHTAHMALALTGVLTTAITHAAGGPSLWAFDNGLTRTPELEQKAALLKDLGYAGIGWRPGQTDDMLKALDRHGLTMGTLYVCRPVKAGNATVDPELTREIETLKGRDTIIWLGLLKSTGATDEIAVSLMRDVADEAAAAGLSVVLYPHVGFYAESMSQVVRLVRKADRPNLGVSFNLCHFLKIDDEENLELVLRDAAPYLKLIQICGADSGDTKRMGWDRLIQPLGKGTFDMRKLLKILDDIDYRGPVNLQCYTIPGDDRVHLKQSMDAWSAWHSDGKR